MSETISQSHARTCKGTKWKRNVNAREKNTCWEYLHIPPGNENHLHILDMELEKTQGSKHTPNRVF